VGPRPLRRRRGGHNWGSPEAPSRPTRQEYAWITCTHAILEDRWVYLPVYGLPGLDEAAAGVYRRVSFEGRPVDASAVYPHGGTLHRPVHVLRREGTRRNRRPGGLPGRPPRGPGGTPRSNSEEEGSPRKVRKAPRHGRDASPLRPVDGPLPPS